jgi:hypothetical protein
VKRSHFNSVRKFSHDGYAATPNIVSSKKVNCEGVTNDPFVNDYGSKSQQEMNKFYHTATHMFGKHNSASGYNASN